MGGNADLIAKVGAAYDRARGRFFETGTEVEFLKSITGAARDFETVDTLAAKWWLEYDAYRKQFTLEVAEDGSFMTDTMAAATHVRIGSAVYVISQGDTIPPSGTSVTWRIFCEKTFQRGQTRPLY
jgi:hypothetical protein